VHADLEGQSLLKRFVAWVVLHRADTIRVVSEKIKRQVERVGAKAPITVLPVYVEISKVDAVVRRPHERLTVLWIGRFEEEKNPLAAIDVFKEVLSKKPDAQLRMLGDGSLVEMVRAKARALDKVELLGWQKDVVPFLETGDVLLCTSLHESWGASIVEALAAGVPVVAPDVGVAREAGAIVVERSKLAEAVIDVLEHHREGRLFLQVPTAKEWALLWRESLLSSRVKT
jgi:glycosyltransferase involved in cell wall biosynthesis